ncbi:amino acid ABC transporter permease, partial [Planococcus sp. SIMBA_143]
MPLDFEQLIPSIPFILEGLKVTLKIVALSGVLGFTFGILLALCKISSIK